MIDFDSKKYMESIQKDIIQLQRGGAEVQYSYGISSPVELSAGYDLNIGGETGNNIVLRSDTAVELGGPSKGSCAYSVYGSDRAAVSDMRITLIGPEISKSMPFGQIILVGGEKVDEDSYINLFRCHSDNLRIEGYMVKSSDENLWGRISRNAMDKGFNLRLLGSVLLEHVKKMMPLSVSAEVIFVTDLTALEVFRGYYPEIRRKYQSVKEKKWEKRGINIYDCAFHGNCGQCDDRDICSEINKIARARKQLKRTG